MFYPVTIDDILKRRDVKQNAVFGEIDLMMLLEPSSGLQVHDYEIKKSNHPKGRIKMVDQLEKERDFWLGQGVKDVWSYYVHGSGIWQYDVELVKSFHPLNTKVIARYKIGVGYK